MRPIDADALKKEIDEWLDSVGEATIAKNRAYYGELMGCIEDTPTLERPRGEWISVEDRLPEENVPVMIWSGRISIARLEKGITMAEREAMKRGEKNDIESMGWDSRQGYFLIKRSDSIRPCDEWGNNLKPYYWEAVDGMGQHFGQDVKYWMPLPQRPEMRGVGCEVTE